MPSSQCGQRYRTYETLARDSLDAHIFAAVGLRFVAFGAIIRLHGLSAAHVWLPPPVTGLEQDGNVSTCKQGG